MSTKERYQAVAEELAKVCQQAGRDPQAVTLVAVSKTVGPEDVQLAIDGGAHDFGENRPDQLVPKADQFTDANWHFIGNIQSRRIRDIVGRATLIHSLFELRHAQKIDACARDLGIVQDVLLEVNVSGEQSKSGLEPQAVPDMLRACLELPNIRVRGLMTMAPRADEAAVHESFAGLARLRDQLRAELPPQHADHFTELSMGMSEDWRQAVEHGATIVRIGRAIFSDAF